MWSLLQHGSTGHRDRAQRLLRRPARSTAGSPSTPASGRPTCAAGRRAQPPPPCRAIPEPTGTGVAAAAALRPRAASRCRTGPSTRQAAEASDFARSSACWPPSSAGPASAPPPSGRAPPSPWPTRPGRPRRTLPLGVRPAGDRRRPWSTLPADRRRRRRRSAGRTTCSAGEAATAIPEATQLAARRRQRRAGPGRDPADGDRPARRAWPTPARCPHLRVVAMRGNGFGPGVLYAVVDPAARAGPAHRHHADHPGPGRRAVPETSAARRWCAGPARRRASASGAAACSTTTRPPRQVHTAVPRFFTGLVVGAAAALRLRRPRPAPALDAASAAATRTLRAVRRVAAALRRRAGLDLPGQHRAVVARRATRSSALTARASRRSPSRSSLIADARARGGGTRSATSASSPW